jgi:peroxin-5
MITIANYKDHVVWNKLGATLANSSQALESLDAYNSAIELYPTYVRARYNKSLSLVCFYSLIKSTGHTRAI